MREIKIPEQIITDIEAEREYAAKYWDPHFDAMNTINDWATYINIYLARATKQRPRDYSESIPQEHERQREALVKVANLAIAALEAFDENEGFMDRHYD